MNLKHEKQPQLKQAQNDKMPQNRKQSRSILTTLEHTQRLGHTDVQQLIPVVW